MYIIILLLYSKHVLFRYILNKCSNGILLFVYSVKINHFVHGERNTSHYLSLNSIIMCNTSINNTGGNAWCKDKNILVG